ncbi:hypothetical protein BS47DRAFT_318681 [Hydnum rufescens UP504]|uniref:holo-[acyl-carrier-protein] synthase n=1 Tax=Hydnum rufescens UP504 TaxID=1448309 RepID=A0A9P6DMX3_9AGAM|nr:hypothetical protein BS47DRAFT_318681 [Hydnum rufescens UP504]
MEMWIAILPDETDLSAEDLYRKGLSRVDPTSRAKITKFYRKADAWRCLLGRLLPRQLLKQRDVASDDIRFDATSAGKPFLSHPVLDPPIAYNIAHDSSLVVMAFQRNARDSLEIGADVMRVALPKGVTLSSFINILTEQLSPSELKNLRETEATDPAVTLQTLFWLWTLKEAYTKTLGLGLGFDFSRITFDVRNDIVYVDEVPLSGFEFVLLELDVLLGRDTGRYQGVAARRMGDEAGEGDVPSTIVRRSVVFKEQHDWMKFWDAADLVENCDILVI